MKKHKLKKTKKPKTKVFLTDVGCAYYPDSSTPQIIRFAWRTESDGGPRLPEVDMKFDIIKACPDIDKFIPSVKKIWGKEYSFSKEGLKKMRAVMKQRCQEVYGKNVFKDHRKRLKDTSFKKLT